MAQWAEEPLGIIMSDGVCVCVWMGVGVGSLAQSASKLPSGASIRAHALHWKGANRRL